MQIKKARDKKEYTFKLPASGRYAMGGENWDHNHMIKTH